MVLGRGPLLVSVGLWSWGAPPPRPPEENSQNPNPKLSTKPGQVQPDPPGLSGDPPN